MNFYFFLLFLFRQNNEDTEKFYSVMTRNFTICRDLDWPHQLLKGPAKQQQDVVKQSLGNPTFLLIIPNYSLWEKERYKVKLFFWAFSSLFKVSTHWVIAPFKYLLINYWRNLVNHFKQDKPANHMARYRGRFQVQQVARAKHCG